MSDYYDLGPYSRTITAASADAQMWFDRGLNWTFNFYHEEAVGAYQKALEADPDCAMAYWGISYALGPNYNMPWILYDPAGLKQALAILLSAGLRHCSKLSNQRRDSSDATTKRRST